MWLLRIEIVYGPNPRTLCVIFNQNTMIEAVRGRGLPGTISVATIRFAGQPSHDARRASAPTVITSLNVLTPLAGQIRRTATPSVQQNSSTTEPDSECIRVSRKASNRGPSMQYLFIRGMCDLLVALTHFANEYELIVPYGNTCRRNW